MTKQIILGAQVLQLALQDLKDEFKKLDNELEVELLKIIEDQDHC
jgi:hypothetical protein